MNEARPICPKCHLPIREGQSWITHGGKTYHHDCAPAPASAGEKDEVYEGPFEI
ncbi:MAG: hypothetical protein ACRD04_04695 [Terriglobales bacterium]